MSRLAKRVLAFQIGCMVGVSWATPLVTNLSHLPLAFERQGGGSQVIYVAHVRGQEIVLDRGRVAIFGAATQTSIDFPGARPLAGEAGSELPGKVNYIQGSDPHKWRTGVSTYASVTYRELYPGIDLVFRGNRDQLEFDLILKPQADPERIRLHFGGVRQLSLDADGALGVRTAAGDLRIALPAVYQEIAGSRKTIAARYELLPDGLVAIRLESYDRTQPVVIDPTIVYTYDLGGGMGPSSAWAVKGDSQGNVYVAGATSASDFPLVNAAYPLFQASGNGFIAKLDPTGATLLYSTYVGGMGAGTFAALALDSAGDLWVTGRTFSSGFPVLNGFQAGVNSFGAYGDAVVMKLNPSGVPLYSGCLGAGTTGAGIAVDPNGNAYVACNFYGAANPPSATAGAYLTSATSASGFIAKLSASGALSYSTYFYGTSAAIAADSSGNAYVTGAVYGSVPNAPTGGAQPAFAGATDAYIAKFNPTLSALTYFTYLGGSQNDFGAAIAIDGSGDVFIGQ